MSSFVIVLAPPGLLNVLFVHWAPEDLSEVFSPWFGSLDAGAGSYRTQGMLRRMTAIDGATGGSVGERRSASVRAGSFPVVALRIRWSKHVVVWCEYASR